MKAEVMDRRFSKNAFYDELARVLAEDGWVRLHAATDVAALFGKRSGDMVLSLGFFESQRYADRLTAEFALGDYTLITLAFPDAARARQRVGMFLLPQERSAVLDPEFNRPGVRDAWWKGRTIATIEKVTLAIRIAEPRFLSQEGLADEIVRSKTHAAHSQKLALVAQTPILTGRRSDKTPPSEWVEAAERLLSDTPAKFRSTFAKEIAADAWRTHVVLPPVR